MQDGLSTMAIKLFIIRLRKSVPNGFMLQITAPDMKWDFGGVSVGVTDVRFAVSTGAVAITTEMFATWSMPNLFDARVDATISSGSSTELSICGTLDWSACGNKICGCVPPYFDRCMYCWLGHAAQAV
jgi:hypothetical protein